MQQGTDQATTAAEVNLDESEKDTTDDEPRLATTNQRCAVVLFNQQPGAVYIISVA